MNEEIFKIIANYGVPTFLLIYFVWWLLNRGVPILNSWVTQWIAATAQRYDNLANRDLTLTGEIQLLMREIAIVKEKVINLGQNLQEFSKKQEWQERKLIDIMNGLQYTKKWDDPQTKE